MLGHGVHHDDERQDVAAHDEHQEQKLRGAEQLAPEATEHDLAGVGHAVDMGVAQLELPYHIACVGRDEAEADDEDDSPMEGGKISREQTQGITNLGERQGGTGGPKGLTSATRKPPRRQKSCDEPGSHSRSQAERRHGGWQR